MHRINTTRETQQTNFCVEKWNEKHSWIKLLKDTKIRKNNTKKQVIFSGYIYRSLAGPAVKYKVILIIKNKFLSLFYARLLCTHRTSELKYHHRAWWMNEKVSKRNSENLWKCLKFNSMCWTGNLYKHFLDFSFRSSSFAKLWK